MLSVHVFFTGFEEILIKLVKIKNSRDRNKRISSFVTDLVLDISFFPAGCWIAENRFETIVFTETLELFV